VSKKKNKKKITSPAEALARAFTVKKTPAKPESS